MAFLYIFLLTVVLSILIGTTSPKCVFFVKTALLVFVFIILHPLPILLFPFRPFDPRNNIIFCKIGIWMLKTFFGVEFKIKGVENVTKQGGVIFLNHQNLMDILTGSVLIPIFETIRTTAKKEVLYQIPYGLTLWSTGCVFIDRTNLESAKKSLNEGTKAIHKKNAKFLFFPEGTRNSGEKLLPFKKGAFHVAIDNQCPIQPVVTSKYFFFNWNKKYFNKGIVLVTVFPEIPTEGLTKNDLPQLLDNIYNLMNDEFQKLNMEALELNHKKKIVK